MTDVFLHGSQCVAVIINVSDLVALNKWCQKLYWFDGCYMCEMQIQRNL